MKRERENNYDVLRILCTFAVIIVHVSSIYINAITDAGIFGKPYLDNMLMNITVYTMPRFTVPCFIMMSGAFALADKKTGDYRPYYRKFFKTIFIPTMVFSLFYCIYNYSLELGNIINGTGMTDILAPVKDWIKGYPFYHMWYMYMMLGVYMLAPIVYRFKEDIGDKYFERIAWVFISLASISEWTSTKMFNWDIGYSFGYLGYFMIGYVIRRRTLEKKNNIKGVLMTVAGVLVLSVVVYQRYQQSLQGLTDWDVVRNITDPYYPLITIGSVLMFAGFSYMRLNVNLGWISRYTFEIYLVHAGVWGILYRVITAIFGAPLDSKVVIWLGTFAVFMISLVLSMGYQKLWKAFESKTHFTDRLCKLLRI